jgi:hypothetical protein
VRPSITEQLAAAQRVLRDVVVPEVSAPYPSDILQGVINTLGEIERSWAGALARLRWDNDGLAAALAAVLPAATGALRERLDAVVSAPAPDPLDHESAQARNAALRDAAVAVIAAARDDASLRAATEPLRLHLAQFVRGI